MRERRRRRERRIRMRPHPPMSMTREERRVVDTMSLSPTFDEAEVDSSVTDALLVGGRLRRIQSASGKSEEETGSMTEESAYSRNTHT